MMFPVSPIILLLVLASIVSGTYGDENGNSFLTCEKKKFTDLKFILSTYSVRSRLECATRCSNEQKCMSANVRRLTVGFECQTFSDMVEVCESTELADDNETNFIKKRDEECYNGGSWNDTTQSCGTCTEGYAGRNCQRRIIDCKEGQLNGQTSTSWKKVSIKPVNSLQSLEVWCYFKYGFTMFWRRDDCDAYGNFNRNWMAYKTGFGDIDCTFFIGLENLHLLTSQRKTRLKTQVKSTTGGKHYGYYNNFRIDNEANNYKLSYESFTSHSTDKAGDGFGMGAPTESINNTPFCTFDRDCNSCAQMSSSGWWFNTNCAFINLNARNSSDLKWPTNPNDNTLITAESIELVLGT